MAHSALVLLPALLVAGLITGFLAGLFGIGGGGILVPVLYETFTALDVPDAVRMHLVLGTSFAIIVPTALRSAVAHHARGAVDVAVVRRLAPAVLAGVAVGVLLVSAASGVVLRWIWVFCGFGLVLKLAFGREEWRLADRMPEELPAVAAPMLMATAIGLISTLMSIGGGMFFVTLLMLYGSTLLNAVATSSAFGPVIAIPAVMGYVWAGWGAPELPPLSLGYVSIVTAAVIIPASVFAAPYGVRAAHGLNKRPLEIAFAAFLTLVAVRLLVSLLAE